MSGKGAPELTVRNCGDLRVAVIAAQWHEKVMDGLVDGALRALRELGIDEPTLLRVPGSFELPVVAKVLAGRGYDAVVALGVVIRGGTPHFEYVCQGVTHGPHPGLRRHRRPGRLRRADLRHRGAGAGPGRAARAPTRTRATRRSPRPSPPRATLRYGHREPWR